MQTIKINDDNTLTIELSTGDRYTLREPLAKDMEGLGQDLIKVKHTDTVQKLLGKISTPPLTRVAYGKLSMSDAQVLNVAIDFFSAAVSQSRDGGSLAGLGLLPKLKFRADHVGRILSGEDDIYQAAADEEKKYYNLINDCLAQCAATFGSLDKFEQCNIAELIEWTHKAIQINTPEE